MRRCKLIVLLSVLIFIVCMASCAKNDADTSDEEKTGDTSNFADVSGESAGNSDTENGTTDGAATKPEATVTNKPTAFVSYGSRSSSVKLNGSTVSVSGTGVSAKGSVVTITAAGTYTVTGSLSDGRIIVNAPKSNVKIVLNDASITCSYGSPIYVYAASFSEIVAADGTSSILTDGIVYTFSDGISSSAEDEPNACLYSKADMRISGKGKLTVNGEYNNGITGKDSLEIINTTLSVTAKSNGITGKDSNVISGASITVNSRGDAIRSTNDTDLSQGYIQITNSVLKLTSEEDGIQAQTALTMGGGQCNIKSGGGNAAKISDTTSAKGLKAGGTISINSGGFVIDSADDSIHSNTDVSINSGDFTLSTGDDGIHADKTLNIKGGKINIVRSYEGLESAVINISGGAVNIVASDDGINAGGGNDGGGGGRFGNDKFSSSGSYSINISGGSIAVNSGGDGVDSNGTIVMTGGEVYINGPTNSGNGALDYEKTFTISGGTLIAAGSSGMAEAPGTSSSQPSLRVYYSSAKAASPPITLKSSDGKTIVSFTPEKIYQCVVISTPDLKLNGRCTLYSGDSKLCDVTLSSTVTSILDTGMAYSGGIGGGRR